MEYPTMTEQAKEARRAYKREWNRRNADKNRIYQARYYEKKAAEQNQQLENKPAQK